jgi:hypothetical protein
MNLQKNANFWRKKLFSAKKECINAGRHEFSFKGYHFDTIMNTECFKKSTRSISPQKKIILSSRNKLICCPGYLKIYFLQNSRWEMGESAQERYE